MSWILRLCVTLTIIVACAWFVMTASSMSAAGPANRRDTPGSGFGARTYQIWDVLGPPNQDNGEADNGEADNGEADNGEADNGADNGEGDEDNDGDDDDDDDDDDDTDDNESFDIDLPPLPPLPPLEVAPTCTTPGKETVFQSHDGRVTLRTFPTITTELRVTITPSYDVLALPPLPGRLAGLLIYDVAATPCDGGPPLSAFPAEVNLNIHYTDDDVFGLDESIVRFSWLDPSTNTLQHVEKQEIVTARNALGATITRTGRYIVYEDP